MRGLIVTSRPQYDLIWTAQDWDLYTDMDGVEDVAQRLNETFTRSVNAGLSKGEVRRIMNKEMNVYRAFGADDTEPRYALDDLLTAVFGEDE